RHLPAPHRVHGGGRPLLHHLLAALDAGPAHGKPLRRGHAPLAASSSTMGESTMTTMKKLIGLAGAAALVAGLGTTAVQAQSPEDIQSRGSVNIGLLVDFPPFGILDAQGNPDGYDADVARLLAEDLGVELNLIPVTGPNRIPYLLSNQIDILVASLGITPERAEQVAFSQPYAGIEIFVFGDANLDVTGPE